MKAQPELSLERFRSFSASRYPLSHKMAIIGQNGAGKSNLIEALRLLSVGKSFKTSRLDDVIQFGAPFFRLSVGQLSSKLREVSLFYGTAYPQDPTRQRSLRVNGQETTWNDYWGRWPSVLFVPSDIEIVIGSPQIRRRYLDSILWQTSIEFRSNLTELGRVLRERSALLFLVKINRAGRDELHPWNELLSRLSTLVRENRRELVGFIQSKLVGAPSVFTSGADIQVAYEEGDSRSLNLLADEIRLAQNLIGPHRDDFEIRFNDQSARKFTSRGQARAIVILLKLAEAAYIAAQTKNEPWILLDDMFSELDQSTSATLFEQFPDSYPIIATSIAPNPLVTAWETINLS